MNDSIFRSEGIAVKLPEKTQTGNFVIDNGEEITILNFLKITGSVSVEMHYEQNSSSNEMTNGTLTIKPEEKITEVVIRIPVDAETSAGCFDYRQLRNVS